MAIDKFSIIKFYEIYSEKLNSLKKDMNFSSEIDTIKKNLIIDKDLEDECIGILKNLINKDKNRLLEDISKQYANLENQMYEDEEMEVDEDDNNKDEENDY